MRKTIVVLLVLIIAVIPVSMNADVNNTIEVSVNNKAIVFTDEKPFQDSNGKVQIPIKFLAENMGYRVEWVQATKQIKITGNGKEIVLTQSSNIATVDGKTITLDSTIASRNGRNFIPLSFIAVHLDAKVAYELKNGVNYISITTSGSSSISGAIDGFVIVKERNVDQLKNNIKAFANILPEGTHKEEWTQAGGVLFYSPTEKPIGYQDAYLIVSSNNIHDFEARVKATTWTIPPLKDNATAKDVVEKSTIILRAYLPTGYTEVLEMYDYSSSVGGKYFDKIYTFDGREVVIRNTGDIFISPVGGKLDL